MLKSLSLFTPHLKGRKKALASLFALGLAGAGASLGTPLIGKSFIDAVTQRQDFSTVPLIAAALVGLALVDIIIGFISRLVHARLSADVLVAMRERLFGHCINAPIETVEKFRQGDLLSRFGSDVPKIQSLMVDGALGALHNVLFLAVAAIILVALSVKLALWSFLGLGVALLFTASFRGAVERGALGIRERMADLSHFLSERLSSLRSVRMHEAQDGEATELSRLNEELVAKVMNFQVVEQFATSLPGLALSLSLAWIYLLGGELLETREISLGTFVAFVLYQGRLYGPATGLLGLVRSLQEAKVSLDRVAEVLGDEDEAMGLPAGGALMGARVCFEGVTFAYGEAPPVLKDLDLSVATGEKVAVFGPSGVGKSTLVQLLFGLRQPQKGRVSVGDCDNGGTLKPHKVLGYACAEPFLLHATVEENLRYGNPNATTEEVVEAARLAEAHGFILSLPEGFATVIGGKGHRLSDGQRQRLGLARMLLKKPEVMVMDEAFSALDPDTEARVRANIGEAFPDKAALVISHRLAGLEEYDRLFLLRDGRLHKVTGTELNEFFRTDGEPRQKQPSDSLGVG